MRTKIMIIVFSCFVMLSCNDNQNDKLVENMPVENKEPLVEQDSKQSLPIAENDLKADSAALTPSKTNTVAPVDWSKKIIKTATVKVTVNDFKKYAQTLNEKLQHYGAYVSQEDNIINESKNEAIVTIKVPVPYFDDLLNDCSTGAKKIVEKSIRTDDVTGQIVDAKARLEAKKQMRLKYLEFLKASKNVGEVIQVQNEINTIQEQIEATTQRYASLSNQTAYSTIQLTYAQLFDGEVVDDATHDTFFKKVGNSFIIGSSFIGDIFIGLVSIWPLLLIAVGAYFLYKRNKQNAAVKS